MHTRAILRTAFTLVEMVVVVMILGLLASIAAPKLLGTSQAATDNGVRQTLSVVRDSIDAFTAAHNGRLPGADGQESTFINELDPHLRGNEFPECPVGSNQNNEVHMMTGAEQAGDNSGPGSPAWAYHYETGGVYINSSEMSSDGETTYDQF
jgi:general secretion pathway protein G